jgi:hypothetical protein
LIFCDIGGGGGEGFIKDIVRYSVAIIGGVDTINRANVYPKIFHYVNIWNEMLKEDKQTHSIYDDWFKSR